MNNSTNKTFRYLLNSNVDDYLTPTPSIASTLNLETLSLNKPFFISGSMKVQILHDYNQTLKEEEAAKDDYDELSRKEFLPDESLNLFLRLSRLNSTFTKQPIINSQLPDLEPHPSELDYETLVEPQTHPDGTTQGMSCIAVFLVMVARWGSSGAFGVYIDYYLSHSSFAGATSLQFAYLSRIILFFGQACNPLALIVSKVIWMRLTMPFACTSHFVAAYLGSSLATSLTLLYICQGAIIGVCYELCIGICISY